MYGRCALRGRERNRAASQPRHLVPRDFESVASFEVVHTERRPNTDGSLTTWQEPRANVAA